MFVQYIQLQTTRPQDLGHQSQHFTTLYKIQT